MNAVLISIQPKWCDLIADGKKTVEVRKTKPKIATPFKVYIYCTKPYTASTEDRFYIYLPPHDTPKQVNGKVIGEFVCDRIRCEHEIADGLVDIGLEKTSCLGARELVEYANGKVLYSWHISDLVIYDKPKGLGKFKHCGANYHYNPTITRPPQSWCYVEEGATDGKAD